MSDPQSSEFLVDSSESHSNKKLLIGVVIAIIVIVLIIIFSVPSAPQYTFIQGVDSADNDIGNFGMADDIPALQAKCSSLPNCLGFNTNGYMKHTLNPNFETSQKWTEDPKKGFYKKNF